MRYSNVFYFSNINVIGGVESYFYYLSKHHKDMVVFYKTGDYNQIKRLAQNVEVHKYNGEVIHCKRAYFNYRTDIIDKVEADEYIQVIHADYKLQGLTPNTHPKINKYIGVSKTACDSFTELTGLPCELCYNPISIDTPRKVLLLVSATRLTQEKGKDAMEKFAKKLDDEKIPYLWLVFTNSGNIIDNPNIVYMKPRLDITSYLKKADYVVQLSKSESYCYTVVESLLCGTPVIVRDLPAFREIGVKNGVNGFVFDMDLINVNCKKIYEGLPEFKYEAFPDKWDIGNDTEYDAFEEVAVKALTNLNDIETGKRYMKDEVFRTVRWRANHLIDNGFVEGVE